MNCKAILAVGLMFAAAIAAPAFTQSPPVPASPTAKHWKGGVYLLEINGSTNRGFIVGDKGVTVIDTQRSIDADKLVLAEIARTTSKLVNSVILTHGDPDHIGGLPAYPADIAIIAHENLKSVMKVSIAAAPAKGGNYVPLYQALANRLPTRTIGASETVTLNGVRMQLIYSGPAHTSADLSVYLPAQRIVFAGDILVNSSDYPVIHLEGNSLGWIAAMKALLALKADTYIPGHGPVRPKAELIERLHAVEQRRARIKEMVDEGKTLTEIKQALQEKVESTQFATFVESTFDELTQGYPHAQPPWANFKN